MSLETATDSQTEDLVRFAMSMKQKWQPDGTRGNREAFVNAVLSEINIDQELPEEKKAEIVRYLHDVYAEALSRICELDG